MTNKPSSGAVVNRKHCCFEKGFFSAAAVCWSPQFSSLWMTAAVRWSAAATRKWKYFPFISTSSERFINIYDCANWQLLIIIIIFLCCIVWLVSYQQQGLPEEQNQMNNGPLHGRILWLHSSIFWRSFCRWSIDFRGLHSMQSMYKKNEFPLHNIMSDRYRRGATQQVGITLWGPI